MLTKETKTVEVYFFKGKEVYFFKGKGPYDSEKMALESYLFSNHTYQSGHLNLNSLFCDKEFLITLGEWAREETNNAY